MKLILLCLLSPVITFLCHCLIERTLFRYLRPCSPQNALVRFLLAMSFLYGTFVITFWSEPAWRTFDYVSIFIFTFTTTLGFGYAYFHFFNMSETARRIHILVLLYEYSKRGDLEARRQLDDYNAEKMISLRIQRMIEMGGLTLQNGKYQTLGGGLLLSGIIFRKLRPLFYGKSS